MKSLLNVKGLLANDAALHAAAESDKSGYAGLPAQGQAGAETVAGVITALQECETVHYYTHGAWSMYELLIALFEITGPGDLYIATYALSETSARSLQILQANGYIKNIYALIDNRTDTRSAGSLQLLQAISTRCVLTACHAKSTVICGEHKKLAVVCSANYTENKRLECGMVTTNSTAFNFHFGWIKKFVDDGAEYAG